LNRLRETVVKRDESLIYIRDTLIPSLSTELQAMYQAAGQAYQKIRSVGMQTVDPDVPGLVFFIGNMARGFTNPDSIAIMKDNFTSYQESRTTCVIDIVKIQAAGWCLACDPEFESKRVSADGIDFSDALVKTLTDSCYSSIRRADIMNTYFSFYQMSFFLGDITAALNKIAEGDMTGTDLKNIANASPAIPQDIYYRPITSPTSQTCSVVTCPWIETDLFKKGKLEENTLAFGGNIPESARRMLREGLSGRTLTAGTWSPDIDEAGVTVTFENSPVIGGGSNNGGSNNDDDSDGDDDDNNGSVLQKGVTRGLVVLLSVLLIFS